jgi:hypothetical protein
MAFFKKIIIIFSAVILLLLAAGCGGNEDIPSEPAESAIKISDEIVGVGDNTGNTDDTINTVDSDNSYNSDEDGGDAENSLRREDGFVFIHNGTSVYIGEYISRVPEELGPALSSFESDSCIAEGTMKTYIYGGFEISTHIGESVEEENGFIFWVSFNDDSVSTAEGIYIGQTVSDMLAAYGAASEESPGFYYKYEKNGTTLTFDVDGDVIIAVTYELLLAD